MSSSNQKYADANRNTPWKYCANNNSANLNNNNTSLISFNEKSQIQEFYNEGKILITGSTGFIGKALTEKLLRTCVTVSTIYLLIRPKRGQSVQERCNDLLQNPVSKFCFISETPIVEKKKSFARYSCKNNCTIDFCH